MSVGIKTLIEEHELQLASIQVQVEHLKRRLADMEHRQAHTKDVLTKLHATLAPIKRLPPELLSEIFEYCLEAGGPRMLLSYSARSREAPLLLGRVCRSWRAIAHATPRLWRDIFVNVCDGRYSNELRRDAFPVLQTWIAHSGGLPLNLVVLCKTERLLPGLLDLFDIVAANAARWKMVRLRLPNAPAIYRLVCRAFSECPSLSTFDVTDGGQCMSFFGNHRQSNEVEDTQPVRFDLSPSPLGHLSLSLAGLTIRDVHASWATLTCLSFMQDARSSTSSITDYVSILQQCTSLKECCLAIDGGIRDAPLQSFSLPSLERLRLQVLRDAAHTMQTGDLLGALDAPRLSALVIEDHCPRREVARYYLALKAFLRAHAQTLRQLRYSTSSRAFAAGDMVGLIAETPLLTELEYHPDEESSPKALLAALTPEGEGVGCLLPRLERLFVYWDTSETVSMVGDLIEKRYALVERGIAPLRYLSCKPVRMSIVYDCMTPLPLVENLAARLEPFCRRGLQVDWEAYRYDLEFLYC